MKKFRSTEFQKFSSRDFNPTLTAAILVNKDESVTVVEANDFSIGIDRFPLLEPTETTGTFICAINLFNVPEGMVLEAELFGRISDPVRRTINSIVLGMKQDGITSLLSPGYLAYVGLEVPTSYLCRGHNALHMEAEPGKFIKGPVYITKEDVVFTHDKDVLMAPIKSVIGEKNWTLGSKVLCRAKSAILSFGRSDREDVLLVNTVGKEPFYLNLTRRTAIFDETQKAVFYSHVLGGKAIALMPDQRTLRMETVIID